MLKSETMSLGSLVLKSDNGIIALDRDAVALTAFANGKYYTFFLSGSDIIDAILSSSTLNSKIRDAKTGEERILYEDMLKYLK